MLAPSHLHGAARHEGVGELFQDSNGGGTEDPD